MANGEFKILVVTIHTLGDLFVPFNMEQVYPKRVAAKGNSTRLVQRAIRGASHCDFTVAESETAFDDMIKWERDGIKPLGDDVVTPEVVAARTCGCKFTKNNLGPDDSAFVGQWRAGIAQSMAACPPRDGHKDFGDLTKRRCQVIFKKSRKACFVLTAVF